MTETETVTTVHGELEVEMTECDHCGNKMKVRDACGVLVGAEENRRSLGRIEYTGGRVYNLCPHCSQSLFGYSSRDTYLKNWFEAFLSIIRAGDPVDSVLFAGLLFGLVTVVIIFSVLLILALVILLFELLLEVV